MRSKKEIIEYLGIEVNYIPQNVKDELIDGAQKIESKYQEELKNGLYGYCLKCDFDSGASWIEDDPNKLEFIECINDVVVYKK